MSALAHTEGLMNGPLGTLSLSVLPLLRVFCPALPLNYWNWYDSQKRGVNLEFVLWLGPCWAAVEVLVVMTLLTVLVKLARYWYKRWQRAVLSFAWKFATLYLRQKLFIRCSKFHRLSEVDLAGYFSSSLPSRLHTRYECLFKVWPENRTVIASPMIIIPL